MALASLQAFGRESSLCTAPHVHCGPLFRSPQRPHMGATSNTFALKYFAFFEPVLGIAWSSFICQLGRARSQKTKIRLIVFYTDRARCVPDGSEGGRSVGLIRIRLSARFRALMDEENRPLRAESSDRRIQRAGRRRRPPAFRANRCCQPIHSSPTAFY